MVNVSQFESVFLAETVKLLNGTESDFSKCVDIQRTSKPVFFRNKDHESIKHIALSLQRKIQESIEPIDSANVQYETYRNNRKLSDIHETVSNTDIEIKLGSATDLNVGVRAVEAIFEPNSYSFDNKDRKEAWRQLYMSDNEKAISGIQAEQDAFYGELVREMSLMEETVLPSTGQNVLTAYTRGITNYDEILRGIEPRKIYRFDLTRDLSWTVIDKSFSNDGVSRWCFSGSVYSARRRFSLFFREMNSSTKIKLILNYKNRYKLKNGVKAPAKLGLGSPSFNGWIS